MLNDSRIEVENPNVFYDLMTKNGVAADSITRMKAKHNNIGLLTINTLAANEVSQGNTGFAVFKKLPRC